MRIRITRPPGDYRSLGVMLDMGRKPYRHIVDLTISLWWVEVAVTR